MFSIYNIVKNRRVYFILSLILIVPGLIAMIINTATLPTHTPWRLSVDFREGTRFVLKFQQPTDEGKIRAVFTQDGVNNPEISQLGAPADNLWQVRTSFLDGVESQKIQSDLEASVGALDRGSLTVESVSPKVAGEVTQAAFWAVLAASLGILVFIWYSFRNSPHPIRFSVCALIALLHDLLVAGGITAILSLLFGWEVDALFLTAMLTIVGFSVQDTIVVYDRIRENVVRHRGESFTTIATRSLVETVHRSLAISLTTILVLLALLLFGGDSIKQFIAVLLIGMASGIFSSIYNAVPLLVAWEEHDLWGTKTSATNATA
ncbi:MAG TPA: protein translocase subunit SecF [Thermoflexales bacterium]|nr:protein translocase subunit SecF [Thermoflexales bacterium]HQW35494.1 protein translocase subunit SecF [Thermoflexales bacterium]HQZ22294.1 protein translocase subunit SecF [Thermoflexales bacterium]HRA00491.1 protein translocase subunit SecF [Thermoflexales bacterium]